MFRDEQSANEITKGRLLIYTIELSTSPVGAKASEEEDEFDIFKFSYDAEASLQSFFYYY